MKQFITKDKQIQSIIRNIDSLYLIFLLFNIMLSNR